MSQTTVDVLAALVIYGAGTTMLRMVLLGIRNYLSRDDR